MNNDDDKVRCVHCEKTFFKDDMHKVVIDDDGIAKWICEDCFKWLCVEDKQYE